jgi:hypothetical protein
MISVSEMDFIDHDRLFKELIQTFFEDFLMLFFPDASNDALEQQNTGK